MHVLVLGGYGFIGAPIARRLVDAGHAVTGLARSVDQARRIVPGVDWRHADIATLHGVQHWRPFLSGVEVVVNAAGALQSGGRDDVRAVHDTAVRALIETCEQHGVRRVVQISAPGATPEASTEFMRSKAAADARLASSRLEWVILRPGLVIGPNAYGGSALLRALAALPFVVPLVHAGRPVQTVAMADVVRTCAAAVDGLIPAGTDVDLVEEKARPLREVVVRMRAWLGIAPARWQVDLPAWVAAPISLAADALGHLGWRSPLRSTALTVLAEGIVGDPRPLRAIVGRPLSDLGETLDRQPATLQDRWFARAYLALPLAIGSLAAFWTISGAVGLVQLPDAAALLTDIVAPGTARAFVVAGAVVDIALGCAVLVRRWAHPACAGMMAMTLVYLAAGTALTPQLWFDPMGAFVKAVPGFTLALVATALLEER